MTNDDGKQPITPAAPANDEVPRPGYFKRRDVILLVSHPFDLELDKINWVGTLNKSLPHPLRHKMINGDDKSSGAYRSIVLKREENLLHSLLHLELDGLDALEPDKWLRPDNFVIENVNALNQNVAGSELDKVMVYAAAPNWLMTGAPHTLTHGGPGGLPVKEVDNTPSQDKYEFNKADIKKIIGDCPTGNRRVDVVIFDTVPPLKATSESPQATGSQGVLPDIKNPIIQDLRSKLDVHRAGDVGITLLPLPEDRPMPGYANKDYYDMSDHGTFIAGIINDFAPDVHIHLVEALNKYGVGATDIFADCLGKLAEDFGPNGGKIIPKRADVNADKWSLVVNFSLCVEFPPANEKCQIELSDYNEDGTHQVPAVDDLGNAVKPFLLTSPDLLLQPLRTALTQFNEAFAGYDVQIVAAAGNEGRKSYDPPPACYPAAFDGVLGVGALESGSTRAWYSNLADNPPYSGVVVFGGKGNPQESMTLNATGAPTKSWSETDGTYGILGAYVGKFPHPDATGRIDENQSTPSPYGWGCWSGTSFAAAVMSGILALAASQNCPISISKSDSVYGRLCADVSTPRTKYGEMIISVPQYHPPAPPSTGPTAPKPPAPAQSAAPDPWWISIWYKIGDFFKRLRQP